MSEEKKPRTVENLTDDEIVDAIAAFGLLGFDAGDIEDAGPWDALCERLGLYTPGAWPGREQEAEFDAALTARINALCDKQDGPLMEPGGAYGAVVFLEPHEWARRLAGLREDSIAAILSGLPQPDDDLTDDEIHRIAFGSS